MGDGIGVMHHYFNMDNSRGKESKKYKKQTNFTELIYSNIAESWTSPEVGFSLPFELYMGITARNLQK